jgi:hypothetical protein
VPHVHVVSCLHVVDYAYGFVQIIGLEACHDSVPLLQESWGIHVSNIVYK